jgi:hypothetical protein
MKETYDRVMTAEEKLRETQEYVKRLRKQLNDTDGDAMRYRRMRQLEVVIMAEDGAKYLKGKDLDDYIDSVPHMGGITRAQIMEEMLPGLNKVFGEEYQRYQDEHAEHIAAHIDAEALRNVKA